MEQNQDIPDPVEEEKKPRRAFRPNGMQEYQRKKIIKNVAKRLEIIRRQKKKPYCTFAISLGLYPTQYKDIVQERMGVSVATLVMIAQKTECGLLWLLGLDDNDQWEDVPMDLPKDSTLDDDVVK